MTSSRCRPCSLDVCPSGGLYLCVLIEHKHTKGSKLSDLSGEGRQRQAGAPVQGRACRPPPWRGHFKLIPFCGSVRYFLTGRIRGVGPTTDKNTLKHGRRGCGRRGL